MRRAIIDSHVHLWPEHMANADGHRWMTPDMPLAKAHLVENYQHASSQEQNQHVEGFVFIETDPRHEAANGQLIDWVGGPLEEIKFLRSMLEAGCSTLLGVVLWAPILEPIATLEQWLTLAEETAGPRLWPLVKGFRYLIQQIVDRETFKAVVQSPVFIENLRLLGNRGYVFDVGVDQHRGGCWQLDMMSEMIVQAHAKVPEDEKTVFVLNHLCKPDLSASLQTIEDWKQSISRLSKCSRTYMKLSGMFSELPEGMRELEPITRHIQPWVKHVLETFGPDRTMYGSDWPVCNLNGPEGDSWSHWTTTISDILTQPSLGLDAEQKDRVWRGTATEAYSLA